LYWLPRRIPRNPVAAASLQDGCCCVAQIAERWQARTARVLLVFRGALRLRLRVTGTTITVILSGKKHPIRRCVAGEALVALCKTRET